MNAFPGRHFQGEIILWAIRLDCKYGISYHELGLRDLTWAVCLWQEHVFLIAQA